MIVEPIPCLSDNYAYYLPELQVVVDPSEATPVLAALGGRPLRAIWCTHHHLDHVGGVPGLVEHFPGITVVGSTTDRDRIPGMNRAVTEGDVVDGARILTIPGHTLGAIAFVLPDLVFTGDTLFRCGCGRLFEGTPAQMVDSLGKLRALPDSTRIYDGHEYLASNIRFAQTLGLARDRVAGGGPPGTIGEERVSNPFLRWDDPALAARVGTETGVACLAEVRRMKDGFRG